MKRSLIPHNPLGEAGTEYEPLKLSNPVGGPVTQSPVRIHLPPTLLHPTNQKQTGITFLTKSSVLQQTPARSMVSRCIAGSSYPPRIPPTLQTSKLHTPPKIPLDSLESKYPKSPKTQLTKLPKLPRHRPVTSQHHLNTN